MHFTKTAELIFNTCRRLFKILPAIFWILVIFGFDTPVMAFSTLLCAVIHEGGHILGYKLMGGSATLKSSPTGFRLKSRIVHSYGGELVIAAFGPAANFITAALCIPLFGFFGGYFKLFALLNLLTGISNLLPVRGYDGYRIADCLIAVCSDNPGAPQLLSKISATLTVIMCFISLYFILIANSGWWLYFVLVFSLLRNLRE
jgi:Zn-dependent protease